MRRHFHKVHGLGNDFVILDAREEALEITPALACHIVENQMLNGEVIRLDGAIRMAPK